MESNLFVFHFINCFYFCLFSYLKNHNDELTFEEVLALDWYDQTVTEEIRRVVQDSLDDLISAEILRHLAYEVYKQLMTERIREAQDTIVSNFPSILSCKITK